MHNLFCRVILLPKLHCTPRMLEYAAALNIIRPLSKLAQLRANARSIRSTEPQRT
ncbi:hypothetical protein [Candidatus Sarmatiella mevalonica]|uniref:hypothetical protein n=1 Tax=Candidatus Sarmatiella mevalonica TaxID=2770581 RepID=UPI001923E872|nr:hypothetical protein [Candidatus Sarmatiella mevalonica]